MVHPEPPEGTALARILRQAGGVEILTMLGGRLSDADLATLLLAAFRIRAGLLTLPDVLRRYTEDRFGAPAPVGFRQLRRTEDLLLAALGADYDLLAMAPVVPFGAHATLAGTDQTSVLATVRQGELAADPAIGLALEAAARRRELLARHGPAAPPVRLAALQRVGRVRRSAEAGRFDHVGVLALVTAGRDTGDLTFERHHGAAQLAALCAGIRAVGVEAIEVIQTVLDPAAAPVAEAIRGALAHRPDVLVRDGPDQLGGRYYTGWCYRCTVSLAGERVEVGGGGFVDWTARLLGNRAERLLVGGLSVDRLARALG